MVRSPVPTRVWTPTPGAALALVLLIAATLRLWAIEYGLPQPYHADEPFLVSAALGMRASGDLNPHFWDYPTFQMYSLLVLYLARDAVATVLPQAQAPGSEYLVGRLLNVAYSVATVWLTHRVGRRLLGEWVGVLAAALVASSYLHTLTSHNLKVDVPATFFALLTLSASVDLLRGPRVAAYALAGGAVGLSAAAKYPLASVAVVVALAHGLAWRGATFRQAPRLVLAAATSVAAFFLASPYLLIDLASFLREWNEQILRWAVSGHEGAEGDVALSYLQWLFLGRDAPTAWLALLGIGWGIRRRSAAVLLVAAFPLLFYAELALLWAVRFQTYLVPMVPYLALLGAYGAVCSIQWLARRRALAVGAVVLAAGLAFQLVQAADYSAVLASGDVRDAADRWMAQHVPAGSRVVREGYTPFLPPERYRVTELWRAIDQDPAWYQREGVEYLVLGSFMYGRFFAEPARYAEQVGRYQRLLANATLLQRIEGSIAGARGARVDVYRLNR
jgi:4-amino-4-deoxy-L-arabinose transferase-like glycosyltransferase